MKSSEEKKAFGWEGRADSAEQKRKEEYEAPKLIQHDPLDSVSTTVYYYYVH